MRKSLISKLSDVLKEIGWIEKRGKNAFHNYNYVMEADLVDAIRGKLAERGIFLFTSVVDVQRRDGIKDKNGNIPTVTFVQILVTFTDGESEFTVFGVGEGEDKSDKGIYKAITGAMKYVLMKNFLVSTGDDPEDDSHDREQSRANKAAENVAKPKAELKEPKPAPDQTAAQLAASVRREKQKKLIDPLLKFFGDDNVAIKDRFRQVTEPVFGEAFDTPRALSDEQLDKLIAMVEAKQIDLTPF